MMLFLHLLTFFYLIFEYVVIVWWSTEVVELTLAQWEKGQSKGLMVREPIRFETRTTIALFVNVHPYHVRPQLWRIGASTQRCNFLSNCDSENCWCLTAPDASMKNQIQKHRETPEASHYISFINFINIFQHISRYGYGSIPINTIFSGMNIHLLAILMFTRGTRFWHTAIFQPDALLRHFISSIFTAQL